MALWHEGPIGVDAHSGLVHTVIGTAGNVSDVSQAQALLHGEEHAAFGDAGYQGIEKRPESVEATVTRHFAEKSRKIKKLAGTALGDLVAQVEYAKARIGAKVEHPFHVVKNLFKHRKTRYKGLAKNTAQCFPCLAWQIWYLLGAGYRRLTAKLHLERRKWPRNTYIRTENFNLKE
jgi:IS5 family transposase